MDLPRFIVLWSDFDKKYLQYVKEDGDFHGFLQFNGDSVVSPYAKFEVEKAKTGNGLVHIRCCYNNKYWVRKSSTDWTIVAAAKKAEEEQSKWSCTLFEPLNVDSNARAIRLRHVQLKQYACLWQGSPGYSPCLYAGSSDNDVEKRDIFKFIDWEALLIMPKYVAFKGDNDLYLGAKKFYDHCYLAFGFAEIQDHNVENEVFATSNGSVRIKSSVVSKFWRRSLDWICPDSDDTTTDDLDTLFWPVKISKSVIALKNLGNDHYCQRLKDEGNIDRLNAAISTIARAAKMEVYELVTSREIHDVHFRLSDSRIYSENKIALAKGEATNDSDKPKTVVVKLPYTETKTSSWDSSVSLKLGVATTIKTGVPFIEAGQVQILDEYEGKYEWGESKTSTKKIENTYKISIKPSSTVTVTLSATKGWCDVPFSYTQTDTLANGTVTSYSKDDGVYTGINCFDFEYETEENK